MHRVVMINPPALVTSIWQLIQYPEPYPYGLLKLGSWLSRQGVAAELIDMMEYNHHCGEFFEAFPDNLVFHSTKHAGSKNVKDQERPVYYLGKAPDWLEEQLASIRKPDEVWVTCCLSFNFEPAHEVIAVVKKHWPDVKVKLGGNYPTLVPEHAATSAADEVVEGKIEEAEDLPGDYSLYPEAPPVALYNFATGCKNKCSFCVNHRYKPKLRMDARQILDYLAGLKREYSIGHFSNWDPNVMLYPGELETLLDLFIESDLDCTLSFDMGIQCNKLTLDLARKMRRAGVTQVTVPFETSDPEMLKSYRKPYNTQAPVRALLTLKEAGFDLTRLHSCSLFAMHNEDPRHLFRTHLSVIGLGVRPIFSPYSPVPTSQHLERVAHLIDGKPPDEVNGYLFPVIDSSEMVQLYERLIALFHTWDLRIARKMAADLPAAHHRLFDEELDHVSGELKALGLGFHIPTSPPQGSLDHETAPETESSSGSP